MANTNDFVHKRRLSEHITQRMRDINAVENTIRAAGETVGEVLEVLATQGRVGEGFHSNSDTAREASNGSYWLIGVYGLVTTIMEFDSAGSYVASFNLPGVYNASSAYKGPVIDSSGNLYIVQYEFSGSNDGLYKFNQSGTQLAHTAAPNRAGGWFNGMAFDSAGDLHVVVASGSPVDYVAIEKYNTSLVYQSTWAAGNVYGTTSSTLAGTDGPSQNSYRTGFNIDTNDSDNFYFADNDSSTPFSSLKKFNSAGTHQWTVDINTVSNKTIGGLVVDNGVINIG